MLSAQVISDLREFFSVNWDSFQSDAKEIEALYLYDRGVCATIIPPIYLEV